MYLVNLKLMKCDLRKMFIQIKNLFLDIND